MNYLKQVCEPSVCSFYHPQGIQGGNPQKPVSSQLASTELSPQSAYKPHSLGTHLTLRITNIRIKKKVNPERYIKQAIKGADGHLVQTASTRGVRVRKQELQEVKRVQTFISSKSVMKQVFFIFF